MVGSSFLAADGFFMMFILCGIAAAGIVLLVAGLSKVNQTAQDRQLKLLSEPASEETKQTDQQNLFTPFHLVDRKGSRNRILAGKSIFFAVLGVIFFLLWFLFGQPELMSLLFIASAAAVLYGFGHAGRKQSKILSRQFPEALDLMVRGGRVGVAPEENMRLVAQELPQPLSGVFKTISEQLDIGLPFEQVLFDMAQKLEIREFRYMAVTLSVQRRTGGRYVDILEKLSQMLREHQEQSLKADAATSEARLAAKIVSAIAGVACVFLFLSNRSQFDFFFQDPTGQNMLIYCVVSIGFGLLIIRQMLERFR